MKTQDELLQEEEFVVIIKLESQVNNLRLTYTKKTGGRLVQIEEVDALERTITSCKFKGRSSSGNCPQDIKDFKPLLGQVKPKEWPINEGIYIDSFYKIY